jgi:hypothetical protein
VDLPALEALTLVDADGKPRRLGDEWRDRAVILVFLRHFG